MSNWWYNEVVLLRLYVGLSTYWYHYSFKQLILLAETKICKQKRQDFHYSTINQITTRYLVIRLSSCKILFQYLVKSFTTNTLSADLFNTQSASERYQNLGFSIPDWIRKGLLGKILIQNLKRNRMAFFPDFYLL